MELHQSGRDLCVPTMGPTMVAAQRRLPHFRGYKSHFFGSFCLSVSTGSKRSPIFSTRWRTLSDGKTSSFAFFFLSVFATSSQLTGVETVGCCLARND